MPEFTRIFYAEFAQNMLEHGEQRTLLAGKVLDFVATHSPLLILPAVSSIRFIGQGIRDNCAFNWVKGPMGSAHASPECFIVSHILLGRLWRKTDQSFKSSFIQTEALYEIASVIPPIDHEARTITSLQASQLRQFTLALRSAYEYSALASLPAVTAGCIDDFSGSFHSSRHDQFTSPK